MAEARKVLHARKNDLEKEISKYKYEEKELMKSLKLCRERIAYRKRLLDEVLDVYNTLKKEID